MTDSNVTGSPLAAAAGGVGPQVTDAFKLLSDEIRLAILLALWEAYDPQTQGNAISFSALFDRVGADDSGNFAYHLDKLVGDYVEETPEGYRLQNSGLKIVRAVIAGSGLEESHLPPTPIPRSCYHCGGPVKLSYEDERLYQTCTECEGNIGPHSTERSPVGTLVVYDDFNPAGLADRSPEDVFVAGTIEYVHALKLLIRGVCPECSGLVEQSLHICESHDAPPGELCPACGTSMRGGWNEARVSYVCSVCKRGASYPAWAAVHDHPAVVAFYHEHGFDMTFGLDDPEACGRLWERLTKDQTLVATDPVRIRVTVSYDGAELSLTLDGSLTVIDVIQDDIPTARGTDGDGDGMDLPDTEECLRTLRRHRWPDGITCPKCGSSETIKKGTTGKDAQRYKCHGCDRRFDDLTGTLFSGHRFSLPEMFFILREMDQRSVAQIARQLDRSYKSILEFVHKARDVRNDGPESTVAAAVIP